MTLEDKTFYNALEGQAVIFTSDVRCAVEELRRRIQNRRDSRCPLFYDDVFNNIDDVFGFKEVKKP